MAFVDIDVAGETFVFRDAGALRRSLIDEAEKEAAELLEEALEQLRARRGSTTK